MERIEIELGEKSYPILIGEGLMDDLENLLLMEDENNFILMDSNVEKFYGDKVSNLNGFTKVVIGPGEKSKTIDMAIEVLKQMLDKGLSRRSTLIAFGGGVVGDLAGFCSSVYMRGIPYIQIPTTLLAQVDSSVGGKTGVNLNEYKNMIGSFHQPKKVIIDINLLSTLPQEELMSGIGEIIKYGLIYDYEFFQYIKREVENIKSLNNVVIQYLIKGCCQIKAQIVSLDEKENGLRKILNFGHTIGHAIEAISKFSKYSHGEAVIVGMYYETLLAREKGIVDPEYSNEILSFLEGLGVDLSLCHYPLAHLIEFMTKDKKNRGGKISFILPVAKGKVEEYLFDKSDIKWDLVK